MKARARKQSLARDHKDSANEHKHGRTLPAEQQKQEFATRQHVSRGRTAQERHPRPSRSSIGAHHKPAG